MTDPKGDIQYGQWQGCTRGTFEKFAAHKRLRIFRRRVAVAAGIAAAGCVLVVAVAFSSLYDFGQPTAGSGLNAPNYPRYGGLSCRVVLERMNAYFAGETSDDQRGRMRQHLRDCPSCRQLFEEEAEVRGISLAQNQLRRPSLPLAALQQLATVEAGLSH